jgi:hypothetical protein
MKISRLAVIIYPLIVWVLAQCFFVWPEFFYFSVAISIILTITLSFLLKRLETKKPWWFFAILPVLFSVVIFVYSSLQTNWLLIQLLFFVISAFLFSYYKSVYYLGNRPDLYDDSNQTILTAYGSFLTIFFLAANLYGLQSFLNLTVWPMFIIFSVVVLIINYLNLNIDSVDSKNVWQFSIIGAFLLIEMALIFVFLPLSYNVSGAAVAIVYYLFIGLTRLYLQKALTSKKVKIYLITSYVGLAILLLSARWLN